MPWGLLRTDLPPHVLYLPLVYSKTLALYVFPNFQRVNLIREVRKSRKGNSQTRQNCSAIKQSQGPLVPPRGYS